ncbi:MAG: ATP-dependent helicase [Chloroflexota bacterium]|nr:ATP-dependent helicase [Chloroflexota bacterium]
MTMAPSTSASTTEGLLAALDPEQQAAAALPDGPAQVIAPAGSGKTTTLIARLGVLLGRGVAADRIGVVTFNRAAAAELSARIAGRLAPHVPDAEAIEVRTLHALARQVLLDAGRPVRLLPDRLPLLRAARRRALAELAAAAPDVDDPPREPPDPAALDTIVSAWKIEGRTPPPEAAATVDAFAALMPIRGQIDFDDLVVGAVAALEGDPRLRSRWQARFSHLCVDEFQDVDAAQLRLVRLLAAPEDNLFVVGDDDQTIYAWRLADVRRILRFSADYPSAHRVMLATNYRCPPSVVEASARMVAVNRERFAKPIRAPAGAQGADDAIAAWSTADEEWPDAMARHAAAEDAAGRSLCFLSRTRSELTPVLLALVRAGVCHATAIPPLVDARPVVALVEEARRLETAEHPFHVFRRLRRGMGWSRDNPLADALGDDDQAALDALMGWAAGFPVLARFIAAYDEARARVAALRNPAALVELATVHAAKGREWETVVLIGFEADRIPNRRSLLDATDPARALEEERRLAYVALTRATRQLILGFDPARPSPFMAEMGFTIA